MRNKRVALSLAVALLLVLSACGGGYYKVTDPTSGKTYYTNDLSEEKSGAVKLKDANTGGTVTLQNSEVIKINKEEFKANTKKQ